MTYKELINIINNEETGIAKGYQISFLSENYFSIEKLKKVFEIDLNLFKSFEKNLLEKETPIDGDFVLLKDGRYARVVNVGSKIQLSNKVGVYIWENGSESSGCTWDPDIDLTINVDELFKTTEKKKGSCWTFSLNDPRSNASVYFDILFKVWELK